MVQLNDHVNDADDVVPEFSEEIKPKVEHVRAEEKHIDFEGKEFKEIYDEWANLTAWSKVWYLSNNELLIESINHCKSNNNNNLS